MKCFAFFVGVAAMGALTVSTGAPSYAINEVLTVAAAPMPPAAAPMPPAAAPMPPAADISGPPTFVKGWGTAGTDRSQFNGPGGILVRGGSVVVADSGNHRTHAFGSDGNFEAVGGHGVVDGANAWQECTSATVTPCLAGIPGNAALQFDNPIDLVDDDDNNTWVTDGNNDRVLVFDDTVPATLVGSFGSAGTTEGQFTGVYGIFVADSSFNAYVTEVGNHRIQKFVPTGPNSVGFERMWGRGVNDGTGVGQIRTATCQAGTSGTAEGEFNGPRKAIVGGPFGDSSGDVLVADTGNHRIQAFDTNGNFLRMWGYGVNDGTSVLQVCTSSCQAGIPGSGDGQLNMPSYLAVDDFGNILVADTANHRVQILDSAGNFLTKFGTMGTGDGQFVSPAGVFFRLLDLNEPRTARIYVTDAGNRVQVFAFGVGGLYVFDGFGGVHVGGNAPAVAAPPPYFGFDAAVDIEVAAVGFYVLDDFGGVHAGEGAAPVNPATPYFGFAAAADLELAQVGVYVLDVFGGVHAGGGAAAVAAPPPYFGFDIARDLELLSGAGMYVLDGNGGVHSGDSAPAINPAPPYFGFDIARDLELGQTGAYVLDGNGGVHAAGGAPVIAPATPYFGADLAEDLELVFPGYYVLDSHGGVHAAGGVPILVPLPPYFGFDIARDMELR